jgi:hypothetical protein
VSLLFLQLFPLVVSYAIFSCVRGLQPCGILQRPRLTPYSLSSKMNLATCVASITTHKSVIPLSTNFWAPDSHCPLPIQPLSFNSTNSTYTILRGINNLPLQDNNCSFLSGSHPNKWCRLLVLKTHTKKSWQLFLPHPLHLKIYFRSGMVAHTYNPRKQRYEIEVGELGFKASLGKVSSRPYLGWKKSKSKRTGGVIQVVENVRLWVQFSALHTQKT